MNIDNALNFVRTGSYPKVVQANQPATPETTNSSGEDIIEISPEALQAAQQIEPSESPQDLGGPSPDDPEPGGGN